jgi:hypothetical protein
MLSHLFDRKDRYNTVVDVTPVISESWITQFNTHNRKLVEAHAARLGGEMKAGRWQLNHQGIAFSENRVLLDGQHRLWAVVLSGCTVPMRVFFNEQANSIGTIDAIRARTNDEIITLAGGLGVVTKSELAALRAMLTGIDNQRRLSAGEEAELLAIHREAIAFALNILPAGRFRGVANAVTRGVMARAFYSASRDKLRHFADVLRSGIASSEDDQPITLLFKFLIDTDSGRYGRPEFRERYGKTSRALSAYLRGERIGRLYSATSELFPLPDSASPSKVRRAS